MKHKFAMYAFQEFVVGFDVCNLDDTFASDQSAAMARRAGIKVGGFRAFANFDSEESPTVIARIGRKDHHLKPMHGRAAVQIALRIHAELGCDVFVEYQSRYLYQIVDCEVKKRKLSEFYTELTPTQLTVSNEIYWA